MVTVTMTHASLRPAVHGQGLQGVPRPPGGGHGAPGTPTQSLRRSPPSQAGTGPGAVAAADTVTAEPPEQPSRVTVHRKVAAAAAPAARGL
jgi:hypothetical protein